MGNALTLVLDSLAAGLAALAAWLWYLASRRKIRRISRSEELDAADINRIVVSINRAQILNLRASLAASLAALSAAVRFVIDIFAG